MFTVASNYFARFVLGNPLGLALGCLLLLASWTMYQRHDAASQARRELTREYQKAEQEQLAKQRKAMDKLRQDTNAKLEEMQQENQSLRSKRDQYILDSAREAQDKESRQDESTITPRQKPKVIYRSRPPHYRDFTDRELDRLRDLQRN